MVLTKELELPEELYDLSVKEFDCDWKDGKVTIKRFRFGEANAISRDAAKIKAVQVGGKMNLNAEIDPTEIQVLTLKTGITTAPWKVNDLDAINELPPPVANWALEELQKFNTITFKKKEG